MAPRKTNHQKETEKLAASLEMGKSRLSATTGLSQQQTTRMQRAISGEEAEIKRIMTTLASPATTHRTRLRDLDRELYGLAGTGDSVRAKREKLLHERKALIDEEDIRQYRREAVNVFYNHASSFYYKTIGGDAKVLKTEILPQLEDLKSDVEQSVLTPTQKKPFLSIIRKAKDNITTLSNFGMRVATKADKFFGNKFVQGAMMTMATQSPMIGLVNMMMSSDKDESKSTLQIEQDRLEKKDARFGALKIKGRRSNPTSSAASVPSTPTSASVSGGASSETVSTATHQMEGGGFLLNGGGSSATQVNGRHRSGGKESADSSGSSGPRILGVLTQHTKLLDGIFRTLTAQLKLQQRLVDNSELDSAESGGEKNRASGVGRTSVGPTEKKIPSILDTVLGRKEPGGDPGGKPGLSVIDLLGLGSKKLLNFATRNIGGLARTAGRGVMNLASRVGLGAVGTSTALFAGGAALGATYFAGAAKLIGGEAFAVSAVFKRANDLHINANGGAIDVKKRLDVYDEAIRQGRTVEEARALANDAKPMKPNPATAPTKVAEADKKMAQQLASASAPTAPPSAQESVPVLPQLMTTPTNADLIKSGVDVSMLNPLASHGSNADLLKGGVDGSMIGPLSSHGSNADLLKGGVEVSTLSPLASHGTNADLLKGGVDGSMIGPLSSHGSNADLLKNATVFNEMKLATRVPQHHPSPDQLLSTSEKGIGLLKGREGMKTHAYKDTAGVWTVGFGATEIDGKKVTKDTVLTEKQADAELRRDWDIRSKNIMAEANKNKVSLTQNQLDALVSFSYNVGDKNLWTLKSSTLWKTIMRLKLSDGSIGGGIGAVTEKMFTDWSKVAKVDKDKNKIFKRDASGNVLKDKAGNPIVELVVDPGLMDRHRGEAFQFTGQANMSRVTSDQARERRTQLTQSMATASSATRPNPTVNVTTVNGGPTVTTGGGGSSRAAGISAPIDTDVTTIRALAMR